MKNTGKGSRSLCKSMIACAKTFRLTYATALRALRKTCVVGCARIIRRPVLHRRTPDPSDPGIPVIAAP